MVSADGATAGNGGTLGSDLSQSFTTGSFSTMRLQELLAQLGYLPMTWTATSGPAISAANAKAQLAAAYRAPAGTFTWQSGWPWSADDAVEGRVRATSCDVGAIRAFESVHRHDHGRHRGQHVWSHLFTAVAKGQKNPNGYTYALANQHYPENADHLAQRQGGAQDPGQHRHPGPPHRGRHLPGLPEVLLHAT